MFHDNGVEAKFFATLNFGDITDLNPGGKYGFEFESKLGVDFDLFARYRINSGSADIDYPVKVNFTVPDPGSYGCQEEITIKTAFVLKAHNQYKLKANAPHVEFALGAELDQGLYVNGKVCVADCVNLGSLNVGSPSFKDADNGNWEGLAKHGEYDFLRMSTGAGLELPWDLYPAIPNPGVPSLTLPLHTDLIPAIEDKAKLSGELDNPFNGIDGPDVLTGTVLKNKTKHEFLDIEFDPIQFQEYFTGVPLTFSKEMFDGDFNASLDILSVPFVVEAAMEVDLEFDPHILADLDFGGIVSWKEMNGTTEVRSGVSQVIEGFKIGHDLKIVFPGNQPLAFTPTLAIKNEFRSKFGIDFSPSIDIRILRGEIELKLPEPVNDIHKSFAVVDESIPLPGFSLPVSDNTFEIGGFSEIPVSPVQLIPDMAPPVVTTRNITVYVPDAGGSVGINPQDVVLSAHDVNGGVVRCLSVTPNTFECLHLGANSVQVTLDDSRCNPVSASAIVTVADRTNPTVVCKSVTAYLDDNGFVQVQPEAARASDWDNCGTVNVISLVPDVFDCTDLGVNTAVLTVDDGHGNTAACNAAVYVLDSVAPAVVCKNRLEVYLDAAGTAAITTDQVFQSGSDNCGIVNRQSVAPADFNCGDIGMNTTTLTVNDGHGNTAACTMPLSVLDNIAPTMLCKNVTVNLDANGQAVIHTAQVNNGSFDNCTLSTLSLSQVTFNCAHLGANVVTLNGLDQSSNSGQCAATVTVQDLIKPVAKCKNTISDLAPNGNVVVAPASVNNGSTDNCSFGMTLTPNSFSCANVGMNTVTFRATDAAGNFATCSAVVTVRDVVPPSALCRNATIYLDGEGHATLSASQVDNGSSDACGISVRTVSQTQFDCSDIQGSAQTVTLTVKDIHNNQNACLAYVTVKDALAPTAVCENTTVTLGANGLVTVYGSDLAGESYDNCSVWSYTPSVKVYTTANLGNNNLGIHVKDWSQNSAVCVSLITVQPFGGSGDRDEAALTALPGEAGFRLFPNPTTGLATAVFQLSAAQSFVVRVFDMTGRIIMYHEEMGVAGENAVPLGLKGYAPGVYLLDFQSEDLKARKRLVLQE